MSPEIVKVHGSAFCDFETRVTKECSVHFNWVLKVITIKDNHND